MSSTTKVFDGSRRRPEEGDTSATWERPAVRRRRDMILGSMKSDNTSWLFENFPDWHKSVYVVDDKNAELTVEQNKGRESMVYLT